MAVAMCQGLEDMLAVRELEGRTKLLFGIPPRKIDVRSELEHRLCLWHDGQLEELLLRAEDQARCSLETRRGSSSQRAGACGRSLHGPAP